MRRGFYWPALALLWGCTPPDAASTNIDTPQDRFPPSVVLNAHEQGEVLSAMRATAAGYTPRPLVAAADGVRWSDVPMAIRNVADKQFLGVASTETLGPECTTRLQMPDGQEGVVVARRISAGEITVTAKFGVLGEPKRQKEFEDAFEAELRRLGAFLRPQE